MPETQRKASLPEKLALFFFFLVPLFFYIVRRRCRQYLQRYWLWAQRNSDTIITVNLVVILFMACVLLGLRMILTQVRGW